MINAPDFSEVQYPAEFHFGIICESNADVIEAINVIANEYTITQKLTSSNTSVSGKYQSYSISIIFDSRTEMIRFDAGIKAVPGVRMLL